MSTSSERLPSRLILSLALVLGVTLVFGQAIGFQALSLDDPLYVTENKVVEGGLSLAGLHWAWVTGHAGLWHPLTWASLMLDVEVWGPGAAGHHLGNVVLHAASAVLVFLVFDRLTAKRWRSWVVAALFALHPLRADSVAWMAERKDVLCTFFTLLTLCAYVSYTAAPSVRRYLLVAAAFTCALLAKAMAIPFPAALLLVDAWPLGRLKRASVRRLVLEKLPLLALSLGSLLNTLHAHHDSLAPTPLSYRLPNVIVSYAAHLSHLIFPYHLSIFYPRSLEGGSPTTAAQLVASALLLGLLAWVAVRSSARAPYVTFGLAWFAGLLFPVSGIIQSGLAARCDRFTYVPCIGVWVALVWLAADRLAALEVSPRLSAALAGVVVASYAAWAFEEVTYYRDTTTVFTRAVESTGPNWMAEDHLGGATYRAGDPRAAVAHFERAIALVPEFVHAELGLADALEASGRSAEAMHVLEHVLASDPHNAQAENAMCVSLVSLGRPTEAASCFERAIADDPAVAVPYVNLVYLYEHLGRSGEAARVRSEATHRFGSIF